MFPERITELKDLHLTTDLREGAQIVVPSGAAWGSLAARLQELAQIHTGADLPLVAGESASLADLRGRHWVALGNAMVNPAIMALYRRQYAFVDEFYPGGDGYVIRTVHNPGNLGHNVLLVGASNAEGGAVALDRLETVLSENGGCFGYTNLCCSRLNESLLPDMTPEAFLEWTVKYFGEEMGYYPLEQGAVLGLAHHLTGDRGCARMFRDAFFHYEDLVRNRYDGNWRFEHMLFNYAWIWRLFIAWDLIEESDAFTDAERLRMTNILCGLARWVSEMPYFDAEEPPAPEIRQNHWTFAGLSGSTSAEYFASYYGIEGFDKQLRICQAVFDGQAPSYKPNDDAAGGWWGYCYLVPYHQVFFDLRRDDFRFLKGGQLRDFADYGVMITDNLGMQVAFGDVWAYRQFGTHEVAYRHKAVSVDLAMLLCTAAWSYDDGGYLWALDWMGGRPYPGCFYRALPKSPPTRLQGATVAPFNPSLHDWVERRAPGGANVPLDEAFDKLVLREGFGADDLYLLLDGTSTFAHGHEDGNSILRLTWKGRMWLAEVDYIWRRPRHHTSVVAICDGESHPMPALTALKWAEDFGGLAFTRSGVPGCNGTDWQRDIVWSKGQFVLVVDGLRLLNDAEYDVRCLWRTLGEVRLEEGYLAVEQDGVHFRILSADASEKSIETEESRVAADDPYEAYPHAGGPVRIYRQRTRTEGHTGDVVRNINLMVAGSEAEVESWEIERIDTCLVRVTGPDTAMVLGDAEQEIRLGDVHLTGGAFALADDAVTLMGGTSLAIGDATFESDGPVHLHVKPAEGRAELRVPQAVQMTVRNVSDFCIDGNAVPEGHARLEAGTHELCFDPFPTSILDTAPNPSTTYAHPEARPSRGRLADATGGLQTTWAARVGGPVRCLHAQGGEIATGTRDGQVAVLSHDGAVLWTADLGAEVRSVHLTEAAGGMLLAGGRDTTLTCYDREGQIRWKRAFPMSHGVHQNVNQVEAVDLTGDGDTEIVVSTDGWMVWALTPDNGVIWQRQIEHHAAKSFVTGDVESDGRQEILVGTEYYNSNLLTSDGTIRWVMSGGPCLTALVLVDLNGDGILESVCGSMDGNVYAVDSQSGEVLWKANLGDDVRHGFALETGGRPTIAAGSESGNVALLNADGQRIWRRNLDAPVTGLCLLGEDRGDARTIAASTGDGSIVRLSLDGEIVGGCHLGSAVTVMQAVELDGRTGVVVGTAGGEVVGVV